MSILLLKTQSGNYQAVETVDITMVFANAALTGVSTAPTAPIASAGAQIANTEFVSVYSNNLRKAMIAMGSDVKAMTLGISNFGAANYTLVSGTANFIAVYLDYATTITGVRFVQHTAGAFTGNNYNGIGLYSSTVNGVLTLVASSTTDEAIWKNSAGTTRSVAFTAPYSAVPGLYFICLLYSSSAQTTAPIVYSGSVWSSNAFDCFGFANSFKIFANVTSKTALPSTQAMSGLSVFNSPVLLTLY